VSRLEITEGALGLAPLLSFSLASAINY
jgi:hypothetical protein